MHPYAYFACSAGSTRRYLAHKRPYARHFFLPYHSSGVPQDGTMVRALQLQMHPVTGTLVRIMHVKS